MLLCFPVQAEGRSSGSVRPYEIPVDGKDPHNSVVFSLKNQVGGLARALQVFQVKQILIYSVIRMCILMIANSSVVHLVQEQTQ
jgi:hypothetical protein